MTPLVVQRHSIIHCDPAQFDRNVLAGSSDDVSLARAWVGKGYPLIARMRRADDPVEGVSLGLPLPLDQGKRRLSLSLHPAAIVRVDEPPLLDDVINSLPAEWTENLSALAGRLRLHARDVRVAGSVAWQFLTTLQYVHPRSDIDLLVCMKSGASLQVILDVLAETDRVADPRIDGEIILSDGGGVSWRELCNSSPDVLVKTLDGPRIRPRPELLHQLQASTA